MTPTGVRAFNANGETLLHFAAQRGAESIVRYLAEKGAKLSLRNKQGRTPLDLASGRGGGDRGGLAVTRKSTAALLRELGAK